MTTDAAAIREARSGSFWCRLCTKVVQGCFYCHMAKVHHAISAKRPPQP